MAPVRATLRRLACLLGAALLAAAPGALSAAQTAGGESRALVLAQAPLFAPPPARRSAPRPAAAGARQTGAATAPNPPRVTAQSAKRASVRAPRPTPRGARFAAKAGGSQTRQQTATLQPAAGSASGARPRAATGRSVQAAATIPNTLSRDEPSLIGVFGGPDTRRALIRTPEGQLMTVRQGDRLARWTVSAIGPDSVQLRDGARAQTLRIPGS